MLVAWNLYISSKTSWTIGELGYIMCISMYNSCRTQQYLCRKLFPQYFIWFYSIHLSTSDGYWIHIWIQGWNKNIAPSSDIDDAWRLQSWKLDFLSTSFEISLQSLPEPLGVNYAQSFDGIYKLLGQPEGMILCSVCHSTCVSSSLRYEQTIGCSGFQKGKRVQIIWYPNNQGQQVSHTSAAGCRCYTTHT